MQLSPNVTLFFLIVSILNADKHTHTHIFLHVPLICQETSGKRASWQVPVKPTLSWYSCIFCVICSRHHTTNMNNCIPSEYTGSSVCKCLNLGLFILKHDALPCTHLDMWHSWQYLQVTKSISLMATQVRNEENISNIYGILRLMILWDWKRLF